jgi:hypothetical protein
MTKLSIPLDWVGNDGDRFVWDSNSTKVKPVQKSVADEGKLSITLPASLRLTGQQIRRVDVKVNGAGGDTSHTLLPDILPTAKLYVRNGGVPTLVRSGADTSRDLGQYEQPHTFTFALNSETEGLPADNRDYVLVLTGEADSGETQKAVAWALTIDEVTLHLQAV